MARPKLNDLDDFSNYLTSQGVGEGTNKTYCSHVRRILRTLPALTEASLTDFLYSSVGVGSRSTVKSAWGYFRGFIKTALGQELPEMGRLAPSAVKAVAAEFTPPPAVQVAIAAMINEAKVSATMLSAATWRSVSVVESKGKPAVYLNVREGKITGALIPKRFIEPLLLWADPKSGTPLRTQPLIPSEAGGNNPAPGIALRRLADKAVDTSRLDILKEHQGCEEEDEVFDLNREVSALMSGREQAAAHPALVVPQPTPEPLPVKAEAPVYNQSRFAIQSAEEDQPMSTAQLLAFIAQQRQV
jgi:hypothetical protein